jgi:hypothetical protein
MDCKGIIKACAGLLLKTITGMKNKEDMEDEIW